MADATRVFSVAKTVAVDDDTVVAAAIVVAARAVAVAVAVRVTKAVREVAGRQFHEDLVE